MLTLDEMLMYGGVVTLCIIQPWLILVFVGIGIGLFIKWRREEKALAEFNDWVNRA